jgi:hypothetical protein
MSQPRTLAEFRGANAEKRPDLATAGSTNYGESRPTTQPRRRASSVAGCSGSEEGRRSLTATLMARRKLCLVGGGRENGEPRKSRRTAEEVYLCCCDRIGVEFRDARKEMEYSVWGPRPEFRPLLSQT